MKSFLSIAIDGGAGSGKSTTASMLSTRLNFMHVDTGSHYRSIAAILLEDKVDLNQTGIKENLDKLKLNSSINRHLLYSGKFTLYWFFAMHFGI